MTILIIDWAISSCLSLSLSLQVLLGIESHLSNFQLPEEVATSRLLFLLANILPVLTLSRAAFVRYY